MPGKFYEDLEVGQRYRHANGRTVTEMDNVLFSMLTMNSQPLHCNEDFSSKTQFGQRIVNGIFSRAFKSQVDPVELAAALQQEIDLQATVINGRHVAPNVFVMELGDTDYARLEPYLANLTAELVGVAKAPEGGA